MQRDLLSQPYGRFYHLPRLLASRGHRIHVLLLSYRNDETVTQQQANVTWESVGVSAGLPLRYLTRARQLMRSNRPEWVAGFSDTYYGILAQRLAARYGACSAIDAYDNFEAYLPWCKPLHLFWRNALSKATLVTAAGPNLAQRLAESRPGRPTVVIPMAADPFFSEYPDQQLCRTSLGLPLDKTLIGYSGSIHRGRGLEVLFAAYALLRQKRQDIDLVLSGRLGRNMALPPEARWLGYLPNDNMVMLLNSLDALIVTNQPSDFGNFSYPVKLYEAMRCGIPVVATDTASTRWVLAKHPELLVPPNNPQALSNAIEHAVSRGRIEYGDQPDWETNCRLFEEALLTIRRGG